MSKTEKYFKIKNGLQFDDGTSVSSATGLVGATGAQGAQGAQGETGAQGNGFDNLISTSSVAIGTGAKGFTVTVNANDTAFAVGNIVSLQAVDSPGSAYGMGGYIAAYSGTSLTVGVTSTVGSGTYSSWSISLTGRTGATGPTGATGAAGADGATGPVGATGADVGVGKTIAIAMIFS